MQNHVKTSLLSCSHVYVKRDRNTPAMLGPKYCYVDPYICVRNSDYFQACLNLYVFGHAVRLWIRLAVMNYQRKRGNLNRVPLKWNCTRTPSPDGIHKTCKNRSRKHNGILTDRITKMNQEEDPWPITPYTSAESIQITKNIYINIHRSIQSARNSTHCLIDVPRIISIPACTSALQSLPINRV